MVDKKKFAEEEAQGYRFSVVGRHLQITDAMKQYALEKLGKLERIHHHILDVHLTMDIQKVEHIVVIMMHVGHYEVRVHAVSTDMYASIDKAVHKLQKQLRRWKDRLQEHSARPVKAVEMAVNVLSRPYNESAEVEEFNAEIAAARPEETYVVPKVIGNERMPLKTITQEEAMMRLELSGAPFLLFRCEEDCHLKVMYRRPDGNYGLVVPETSHQ